MIIPSRSAWVLTFSLATGALCAACGGSNPPANGPPSSGAGAGSGQGKELADTPATTKADPGATALLDRLLADTAPAGGGAKATAPPPAAPPAPRAAPSGADTFDDDVKRIKESVPGWDNGTGLTARFLNESKGTHISLIYVDPTAPEFNKELGYWVIAAKAKSKDKVLAHFVILMKDVTAGRFEANPQKKDVVVISQIGETFAPKGNDTMWSSNNGAWFELTLRPGRSGRHLEGNFRAKLTSNDGQSYQTVESGYLYVNRP